MVVSRTAGTTLFELLLTVELLTPLNKSEAINQFCADVVGIGYATDNFTDDEWERFVYCRESIRPVVAD